MTDDFSGMSLIAGSHRFMLINSSHPIGRQHFTIGHELFHLFIQSNFEAKLCNGIELGHSDGPEEKRANAFSSYLLLPWDGVLSSIPKNELGKNKVSLNTVYGISHYYSASHTSVLYRLKDMDLIDSNLLDSYSNNVISNAEKRGLSTTLYKSGNEGLIIGNYGLIAHSLYSENIISKTHYVEIMRDINIDVDTLDTGSSDD